MAPTTGQYRIYSATNPATHDVVGYLYNAAGSQIASDDDSAGNRDFLITANLTAGQTYYAGIRNYSPTTTATPTWAITIQKV